ncbi:YCII-related domain-containing protein [Fusarium denticulatum]|uniref:YCII-related domain-containing protein n=1 Tax=Fusarium denticulatum TaxID=48507 RepID=A0A8H5X2C2_9HYPO|nr:YCII-related domain-containing protein [Fusarium denticulatum]
MPPKLEPCLLVQVPDKPGDEIAEKRRSHQIAHMTANKVQIDLGRLVMAGPTTETLPSGSDQVPPAITGSVMVWKGHEDEVRAWLDENPYALMGVWDLESAMFTPFLCAVRKPM